MRLRLSPQAEADIEAIALYIAIENPRAALAITNTIHRRLQRLVLHPQIGLQRNDIGPDVRRVVIGQYLAFYRATTEAVDVLRVLHGKRHIDPDMVN